MLQQVVVLLTVNFFVVFTLTVRMAKFDPTHSSYRIMFASMLQISNLIYFMFCWIVKYVGLKTIIFAINMDVVSSFKVFSTLDYVFISIVLLN